MTDRCPSSLALEAVLLEPRTAKAALHAKGCEKCQARLVQMEREGEEFSRFVFPATLAAVEKPARGFKLTWALVFAPAALAALALVFAVRPSEPPSEPASEPAGDYVGAKGAALKLSVYTGGAGKARELAAGEEVPASAALRFRVQASSACRLWIVSIDESGQVSRLFPASGTGGAPVQGLSTLPGGVELDGHPGPERLYAVCTSGEVGMASIEAAVRGAASGGTQKVRAGGPLAGLPKGSSQATVLLEKKP